MNTKTSKRPKKAAASLNTKISKRPKKTAASFSPPNYATPHHRIVEFETLVQRVNSDFALERTYHSGKVVLQIPVLKGWSNELQNGIVLGRTFALAEAEGKDFSDLEFKTGWPFGVEISLKPHPRLVELHSELRKFVAHYELVPENNANEASFTVFDWEKGRCRREIETVQPNFLDLEFELNKTEITITARVR